MGAVAADDDDENADDAADDDDATTPPPATNWRVRWAAIWPADLAHRMKRTDSPKLTEANGVLLDLLDRVDHLLR